MNAETFTAFMDRHGIKEVRRVPFAYDGAERHFSVLLRCGGPTGIGATVEDALDHARELNADWLEVLQ